MATTTCAGWVVAGTTAAAGLAVGFYKNLDDLCANWAVDKTWKPNMDATKRESEYKMWKKAVTRTFDWVEETTKVEETEKELVGAAK